MCQANWSDTLDFGDMEIGAPKHKVLRIANINPKTVVLNHISKRLSGLSTPLVDDLAVILHRVANEKNQTVSLEWVDEEVSSELMLFNTKRSKRTVGLFIPPFYSVYLKLKVQGKQAGLKEGSIDMKFLPKKYGNMTINYSYNVHDGSLSF